MIRFQAAIRVDQLQVRSVVNETSERHGLWELVHCRSEKEGRPETIFQFARLVLFEIKGQIFLFSGDVRRLCVGIFNVNFFTRVT